MNDENRPEEVESGSVFCPCGGTLISNSGKAQINFLKHELYCWVCHKGYLVKDVYAQREHNKAVNFNPANDNAENPARAGEGVSGGQA